MSLDGPRLDGPISSFNQPLKGAIASRKAVPKRIRSNRMGRRQVVSFSSRIYELTCTKIIPIGRLLKLHPYVSSWTVVTIHEMPACRKHVLLFLFFQRFGTQPVSARCVPLFSTCFRFRLHLLYGSVVHLPADHRHSRILFLFSTRLPGIADEYCVRWNDFPA